MKKNILNDKVIRAMAIGISAMLATATPMSVMAADGVDDTEGGNPNEAEQTTNPTSNVCDDAQQAASEAADKINTAKGNDEEEIEGSVATIKDDVKENVVAGEAGKDSEGNDLAQGVIDAANELEKTNDEGTTSLTDAGTAITNTDIQLDTAEANDGLSKSELNKATDAATNAGTIAEDVKNAMDAANEKADQQVQNIENATTVADANAAYDDLAATASAAQEEFNTKLEEYNAAKEAYDAAAADVAKYEKAYNDAIATAASNAEAAKAELEAAQANAAALEAAVSAAKDAVDASAAEAMAIAEAEKLTQTDGGLNWRNEDALFKAIMENYYLPEIEKIEGATVTRVQGIDNNEYNYFKVEYKDADGKPQVKYYNYKMDDDGKSTDNIVIFEKRDVEVNGGAFDQYVDDDGNVVDTAKGKEDGTVVEVKGEYVKKNDVTGSETLVSNSEITGTSKKDVTIIESTKQESYQLDEEGNLVKTVTADVTTVTYTDATFTSDKSYATDAERDAAAAEKKSDLEKTSGKDATINETENTTYTGTATYIPTFTKTVNVKNEEVESGRIDWLREADSDAEAVAIVKEEQEKALRDDIEDDGLYCINVKSDLAVTGHTKDRWYDDSDYLVSGTVTATYAKVTKKTVDQSTFGSLWDDIKSLFGSGQSTNEKLEEAARKAVEADGGIFVSANWVDWSFNKATIKYVAASKVETDKMQTAQAAKTAVQDALTQAKTDGVTGLYNVKTNTIANTTYSYTVDYLQKDKETTETKDIATETYGNADVLEGQIIQNKNYYDAINNGKTENILLTQKDTDYRTFVDDAKAITDKYDRLLGEAKQANADVLAAQEQVKALQEEIKALKGKSNNVATLTELAAKLETAKANRDAAEDTLNEILEKLENAGITRNEVINRLTPPSPTGGDGGETGGAPSGTTTVTGTPVTTAAVQSTGVTATVATTTVGTGAVAQTGVPAGGAVVAAAGNQEEVTIADEETPLAVNTEENNEEDTTVISDEETPLAAEAMEEKAQQEKMSWWWLLIVAILGATGYEMYRKHQEKKKAAVETKSEK